MILENPTDKDVKIETDTGFYQVKAKSVTCVETFAGKMLLALKQGLVVSTKEANSPSYVQKPEIAKKKNLKANCLEKFVMSKEQKTIYKNSKAKQSIDEFENRKVIK